MSVETKLIGPFSEILTFSDLPLKGPIKDEELKIINNGWIAISDGKIMSVGSYAELMDQWKGSISEIHALDEDYVAMPGFIDAHTHICFAGSRAKDYAARNNGKTYLEIAESGGGIWDTVQKTRKADFDLLLKEMLDRADQLISSGVCTVEVKSGYGLSVASELKMLECIQAASTSHKLDFVSTCLAAHIIPREFENETEYLNLILKELVPEIKERSLCSRFDIFIEKGAFSSDGSKQYFKELKRLGFDLTVHADQFHPGGSAFAIEMGALSADHLEASGKEEIQALAKSETSAVVLPGASLGLGLDFAPARKLLDAGCSLVIASDWNPGSAPHGDLLTQAAFLGAKEKLSAAEVFSGICFRSAHALNLKDRGMFKNGNIADIIAFPCDDHREILYQQGSLKPELVWKRGELIIE